MYVPRFNALDGVPEIQSLVMQVGSAQLVTTGADGYPLASMLPVIWEPAGSRLVMHMAKANQHWKAIEPDTPALAVVAVRGDSRRRPSSPAGRSRPAGRGPGSRGRRRGR